MRIELITSGEQSGTWGITTNSNLGTLIESAITGYVTVNTTAVDQALTVNNGAPDESRNMVLNLTTSVGANFNVYIPPVPKMYIVRNSSARQATLYCSDTIGSIVPKGTGTVIPANKSTILFTDGTNVSAALSDVTTADFATNAGTATNAVNLTGTGIIGAGTTATTQPEKTSDVTVATTAFVDRLRSLSSSSTAFSGTLVIGDRGALVRATGTITVPPSVFSIRDVVTIYNFSAGSISIAQGGGMTLYQAGTVSTGNRTLAARGLATIVFLSVNEAVISGSGIS